MKDSPVVGLLASPSVGWSFGFLVRMDGDGNDTIHNHKMIEESIWCTVTCGIYGISLGFYCVWISFGM
jgi:hypothetical protein